MEHFYFVYVLQFSIDREWYIGFTEDIPARMKEHAQGKNISTRCRGSFRLIYYEAYLHKLDALGREKFLKSGSGHQFLHKQLRHFFG